MRIEAALRAKRARVVTIRMAETVMVAMRRLRSENIGILAVKDSCGLATTTEPPSYSAALGASVPTLSPA